MQVSHVEKNNEDKSSTVPNSQSIKIYKNHDIVTFINKVVLYSQKIEYSDYFFGKSL